MRKEIYQISAALAILWLQVRPAICCMQYDDRVAHTVLNDPVVRSAIHAGPFANQTQSLAGFFEMCTARVNLTGLVDSTLPYHQRLIERGAFGRHKSSAVQACFAGTLVGQSPSCDKLTCTTFIRCDRSVLLLLCMAAWLAWSKGRPADLRSLCRL